MERFRGIITLLLYTEVGTLARLDDMYHFKSRAKKVHRKFIGLKRAEQRRIDNEGFTRGF